MEMDNFANDILGEDELGAIVRGHIHVEQALNEYLQLVLPYPKYLNDVDLDFFEKCSLALSCGLEPDLKSPLRNLGKLRNRFSHQLGIKITKQEAKNLYGTFTQQGKQILFQAFKNTNKDLKVTPAKGFKTLAATDQVILMVVAIRAIIYGCIEQINT